MGLAGIVSCQWVEEILLSLGRKSESSKQRVVWKGEHMVEKLLCISSPTSENRRGRLLSPPIIRLSMVGKHIESFLAMTMTGAMTQRRSGNMKNEMQEG